MKRYGNISENNVVDVNEINVRVADLYSGIDKHTDYIYDLQETTDDLSDRILELERLKKGYYLIAVSGFGGTANENCNSAKDFVSAADLVLTGTAMETKLNSFINSVSAGSILLFAPGDYIFTDSIVIKKSITLMGMNHNAIFHKRNAEKQLITINESTDDTYVTNVIIEKLYFKADGGLEHGTGMIYAYNANGLHITKCGFIYEKKSTGSDEAGYVHLNGYVTNALLEANIYSISMSDSSDTQKVTINCKGITGKSSACIGACWNTVTVLGKDENMSITTYGLWGYKEVSEI